MNESTAVRIFQLRLVFYDEIELDFYRAKRMIQCCWFQEETSASTGTAKLKCSSKTVLRKSPAQSRHVWMFQCKGQRIAQLLISQQIRRRCRKNDLKIGAGVTKRNRSNVVTYDGRCLHSAARNCQSFLSFKNARIIGRIWNEYSTPKKLHNRGKLCNSACLD